MSTNLSSPLCLKINNLQFFWIFQSCDKPKPVVVVVHWLVRHFRHLPDRCLDGTQELKVGEQMLDVAPVVAVETTANSHN